MTTGCLLSEEGMTGLYKIMEHITGDPHISTIGIYMMADQAKTAVLKEHPKLEFVFFPLIDDAIQDNKERMNIINAWLAEQEKCFGKTMSISRMGTPRVISLGEEIECVRKNNPQAKVFVATIDP